MIVPVAIMAVVMWRGALCAGPPEGEGWEPLFNGTDLTGWRVPEGDNGHWKVVEGVVDYDACSEAKRQKHLWTEKEYGDFTLRIDWRLKRAAGESRMPVILPDGSYKTDGNGKRVTIKGPNADSGIYLRGNSRSQVNIWCWPVGSGEVYGYRTAKRMPPEVRAGVTPKVKADNPVGEWNSFEITMKGDRLTVVLNGKLVIDNAQLPGVPKKGAIALQHHGGMRKGKLIPASSLIQFRSIYIKEL